jgi:dihydrofolate synthase/folylpolyglutamate synthase
VLRTGGRRTGHYISPHLHRYNERIRLNGQPAPPDVFASAMTETRTAIERVAPACAGRAFLAFDALTAAAFVAFREHAVDIQIIEVGLGGTLDSTNVFHTDPRPPATPTTRPPSAAPAPHDVERGSGGEVVIITPISLEHTAILGDTIPAIAAQKAGIITDGATVVVAPQRESALDVIREVARDHGATVIEVAASCQVSRTSATADGQQFRLKTPRATYAATLPLAGRHQLENAATAIIACEELAAREGFEVTTDHVRKGLAGVAWPARLEVLKRRPLVIVDGAHNGDSAKRMAAALADDFALRRATFLFGTLEGKDVAAMAAAVAPMAERVLVTAWPSARAADPRECAAAFRAAGADVASYASLPEAFEAALAEAAGRGAVVAFGSLAFAAAVREYVLGIESDMIRLRFQAPGSGSG